MAAIVTKKAERHTGLISSAIQMEGSLVTRWQEQPRQRRLNGIMARVLDRVLES